MRTSEQISQISSRISSPVVVENFLSDLDVQHLISLHSKFSITDNITSGVIKKNTGPETLDLNLCIDDPIIKDILKKINLIIGDFEITSALFFKTDYPHIIHNDDTYELPDTVYKAITIPLDLEGEFSEYPKLCFFDQFYFHGPAKFFNGEQLMPTYFNKCIYDYKEVAGITDSTIVDDHNLFSHMKPKWLEGLSLHSTLPWVPTSALIFDSVRLHCASDFRRLGIKSKLGLSIFTRIA